MLWIMVGLYQNEYAITITTIIINIIITLQL